jgi:hypothetical protein
VQSTVVPDSVFQRTVSSEVFLPLLEVCVIPVGNPVKVFSSCACISQPAASGNPEISHVLKLGSPRALCLHIPGKEKSSNQKCCYSV